MSRYEKPHVALSPVVKRELVQLFRTSFEESREDIAWEFHMTFSEFLYLAGEGRLCDGDIETACEIADIDSAEFLEKMRGIRERADTGRADHG